MKEVCDLDRSTRNYGWCFDCVPEENSLLLGFGEVCFEIPSLNLVFDQPRALLGEEVHARFGDEFPIRFDFLDTMGGGNLSFQVHPLTEYIQQHFGMHYTQDESYYLLDAGPECERLSRVAGEGQRGRHGPGSGTGARWRSTVSGGSIRQQMACQKARPFPHSGRHRALCGGRFRCFGNQCHALHFHLQAVGLGQAWGWMASHDQLI